MSIQKLDFITSMYVVTQPKTVKYKLIRFQDQLDRSTIPHAKGKME